MGEESDDISKQTFVIAGGGLVGATAAEELRERGFDGGVVPGAGEPLAGLDKPYDEMWWVKRKLRNEGLTYLPPSLALRKEAQDALEAASKARSEAEVRRIIEDINAEIRKANREGIPGPPLMLMPYDVDRVVSAWREQRQE